MIAGLSDLKMTSRSSSRWYIAYSVRLYLPSSSALSGVRSDATNCLCCSSAPGWIRPDQRPTNSRATTPPASLVRTTRGLFLYDADGVRRALAHREHRLRSQVLGHLFHQNIRVAVRIYA